MARHALVHRAARGVLALALATSAAAIAAPPAFTATKVPVAAGRTSYGTAVNEAGDVVGWSAPTGTNTGTAFLFSAGVLRELPTLGGDRGYAAGVNDLGDVVGVSYERGSNDARAVLWAGGTIRSLHPTGSQSSRAEGINAAGDIVGMYVDAGGVQEGFLRRGDATMPLGSLGGGSTYARAVNRQGEVAGYTRNAQGQRRAFLYSGGSMLDLGTLGSASFAFGLNGRADVVGYSETATSPARAFLYTGGAMTPLGTLGGNTSSALGINDAGWIVGTAASAAGANRAFLYADGVMTDLNALVASGLGGTVLTDAIAINDRGAIVAQACTSALACSTWRLDPLTPGKARLVEYYHAAFDHNFVTAVADEIAKLDSGVFAGWIRTGEGIDVDVAASPDTRPVCRFFSAAFAPKSSHFYTPDAAECAKVKGNPDWQFEGEVFHVALPDGAGACPAGKQAVHRLYNDGMSGAPNHRFTTRLAVRDAMIARGWIAEGYGLLGVAMCV